MRHQENRPSIAEVQRRIADTPEPSPKIAPKRPAAMPPADRYAHLQWRALRLYDAGLWPSQIAGRLALPHAVVSGWVREVREKEEFR